MEPTERIAQLETALAAAQLEIRNSHALLALLTARAPGGLILNDTELASVPLLGQLSIHRDERVPGCVITLQQPAPAS